MRSRSIDVIAVFSMLVLHGQQAVFGTPTIRQFGDRLLSWKYEVRRPSRMGEPFTVSRDGVTVYITGLYRNASDNWEDAHVVQATGVASFALAKYLPQSQIESWAKAHIGKNADVRSYLDGVVQITALLVGEAKYSEDDVKARLQLYFADARSLGSRLTALRPESLDPWQLGHAPLDDTVRVATISDREVRYIINESGWTPPHGWGGSSNGWFAVATVEGVDVTVHGGANDRTPPGEQEIVTKIDLGWSKKLAPAKVAAWSHKSLPWARVETSGDQLILKRDIDFSPGLSVGECRGQVTDFARHIQSLRFDVRAQ